jgi:hypothetical protein
MSSATETVHMRLPAELVAALDAMADREMRSRASMAGYLVARGLEWPEVPNAIGNFAGEEVKGG